jgi:hypothetical protein
MLNTIPYDKEDEVRQDDMMSTTRSSIEERKHHSGPMMQQIDHHNECFLVRGQAEVTDTVTRLTAEIGSLRCEYEDLLQSVEKEQVGCCCCCCC